MSKVAHFDIKSHMSKNNRSYIFIAKIRNKTWMFSEWSKCIIFEGTKHNEKKHILLHDDMW